jgi:Abortive infection alpha
MTKKKSEPPTGVSIVVPPRSTGRLVDAFTDMFRPFSEARGLKADQIRLRREEVAIEIAKRAKERLAIGKTTPQPVRAKILIPLIEAASNEEIEDDYMVDKWANLLASASRDNKVEPRFVGILRELTGRQAALLEKVANNNNERYANHEALLEDAALTLDVNQTRRFINAMFRGRFTKPELSLLFQDITDELDRPGCAIMDIMIFVGDDMWSMDKQAAFAAGEVNELDMEILVSLGLSKRVQFYYVTKFGHDIEFVYYHITELGIRFFRACQSNPVPETDK